MYCLQPLCCTAKLDKIYEPYLFTSQGNGWEMAFVAEATKTNLSNFKTYLGLDDLMKATLWMRQLYTLHKKWSFSLRIFSVNVTKSAVSCGYGHIYEEIFNGKLHFLCSDNDERFDALTRSCRSLTWSYKLKALKSS